MEALLVSEKACTACLRVLPFEKFHKHAKAKFGLRPKCKDCIHKQRTAYYDRTRERSQDYSRQFYAANRPKVLKYQKRFHKENRAEKAAYHKKWRAENREKLLAAKRVDYSRNREHYRAINSLYQKAHPEYGRVHHHRRRANKSGAAGDFTAADLLTKFEYFGWRCYLCHESLTIKELEIDHRIPLSRGGSNWIANIAPACHACNQAKRTLTESEYRQTMR